MGFFVFYLLKGLPPPLIRRLHKHPDGVPQPPFCVRQNAQCIQALLVKHSVDLVRAFLADPMQQAAAVPNRLYLGGLDVPTVSKTRHY